MDPRSTSFLRHVLFIVVYFFKCLYRLLKNCVEYEIKDITKKSLKAHTVDQQFYDFEFKNKFVTKHIIQGMMDTLCRYSIFYTHRTLSCYLTVPINTESHISMYSKNYFKFVLEFYELN